MRNRTWNSQLVVGLVIITIGILFVLDNLDVMYAWDILRYWPAIFIVIGLAKLAEPNASRFWPVVFIVGGSLLLMDRMDVIVFRLHDWWPLILIAVGGTILWSSMKRRNAQTAVFTGSEGESDESVLNLTAVMGGFDKKITSQNFSGGNITTIMGGAELDFRHAQIKGDEAVLEIFALMGGVEMRVPETWRVVIKGVPFMGGYSDETRPAADDAIKRLIIQGNVIMGAVEIKN